jgi:hypothetical protein
LVFDEPIIRAAFASGCHPNHLLATETPWIARITGAIVCHDIGVRANDSSATFGLAWKKCPEWRI